MRVLFVLFIVAASLQKVTPVGNCGASISTEYKARYHQVPCAGGKPRNGTIEGNHKISSDSGECDAWEEFAARCADILKDLVSAISNAITIHPGDQTNLQLDISNHIVHKDQRKCPDGDDCCEEHNTPTPAATMLEMITVPATYPEGVDPTNFENSCGDNCQQESSPSLVTVPSTMTSEPTMNTPATFETVYYTTTEIPPSDFDATAIPAIVITTTLPPVILPAESADTFPAEADYEDCDDEDTTGDYDSLDDTTLSGVEALSIPATAAPALNKDLEDPNGIHPAAIPVTPSTGVQSEANTPFSEGQGLLESPAQTDMDIPVQAPAQEPFDEKSSTQASPVLGIPAQAPAEIGPSNVAPSYPAITEEIPVQAPGQELSNVAPSYTVSPVTEIAAEAPAQGLSEDPSYPAAVVTELPVQEEPCEDGTSSEAASAAVPAEEEPNNFTPSYSETGIPAQELNNDALSYPDSPVETPVQEEELYDEVSSSEASPAIEIPAQAPAEVEPSNVAPSYPTTTVTEIPVPEEPFGDESASQETPVVDTPAAVPGQGPSDVISSYPVASETEVPAEGLTNVVSSYPTTPMTEIPVQVPVEEPCDDESSSQASPGVETPALNNVAPSYTNSPESPAQEEPCDDESSSEASPVIEIPAEEPSDEVYTETSPIEQPTYNEPSYPAAPVNAIPAQAPAQDGPITVSSPESTPVLTEEMGDDLMSYTTPPSALPLTQPSGFTDTTPVPVLSSEAPTSGPNLDNPSASSASAGTSADPGSDSIAQPGHSPVPSPMESEGGAPGSLDLVTLPVDAAAPEGSDFTTSSSILPVATTETVIPTEPAGQSSCVDEGASLDATQPPYYTTPAPSTILIPLRPVQQPSPALEEEQEDHSTESEDSDCSCDECYYDDITDHKTFCKTACKDLEEARDELKAIFEKIKKKLRCISKSV